MGVAVLIGGGWLLAAVAAAVLLGPVLGLADRLRARDIARGALPPPVAPPTEGFVMEPGRRRVAR